MCYFEYREIDFERINKCMVNYRMHVTCALKNGRLSQKYYFRFEIGKDHQTYKTKY